MLSCYQLAQQLNLSDICCYSVYYQLQFVRGRHLLRRKLRSRHNVITWTIVLRLIIHSNFHHNYHHLVFSVTVTVLLKIFIHSFVHSLITSIINALMSLYINDSVLKLILLLSPFGYSVFLLVLNDIQSIIDSLLKCSQNEIKYITLKTGKGS